MKKMLKRTMSMLLTLVMLTSCFVLTNVNAAGEAMQDFEGWTTETLADKIAENGWSTTGSGMEIKSFDDGHGAALMLPQVTDRMIYNAGKTSGQWKVEFSINSESTNNINLVFLTHEDRAFDNAKKSTDSGNNLLTADSSNLIMFRDGKIFIDSSISDQPWAYVGDYTANTWYDVVALVDMDTKLYNVTVSENGTEIGSTTLVMPPSASLNKLAFVNWGDNKKTYIDNVNVTPYGENVNVLLDENFDSYTGVAYSGNTFSKANLKNNWWLSYADGSTVVKDPTIEAFGESGNNVIGFSSGSGSFWSETQGIQYTTSNPIVTGIVRVKGSVYMTDDKASFVLAVPNTRKENYDNEALFYPIANNGNKISTFNWSPNAKSDVFSAVPGEWYDFTFVIDYDTKLANMQIKRDGMIVAAERNVNLDADNSGGKWFAGLRIRPFWSCSADGNADFYMDNIKVEVFDKYKTATEEYAISDDDFEYAETAADIAKNGWNAFGDDTTKVAVATEDGSNAIRVAASGSVMKKFADVPTNANASRYKFTYDVKTSNADTRPIIGFEDAKKSTSQNWYGVLANFYDGGIYSLTSAKQSDFKVANVPQGSWVTIENVLDLQNGLLTTTVWDRATKQQLGTKTFDKVIYPDYISKYPDNLTADHFIEGMQSFQVRTWGSNAETDFTYIDNVKLEYYYTAPKLDAGRISMTDIEGNQIENIAADVNPAIKAITLDFGDTVTASSAAANITLQQTNESGSAVLDTVALNGEVQNLKYVLSLPVLKENSYYKLTVGKDVENSEGLTLGEDVVLLFNTTAGEVSASKAEIYLGETPLTGLASLAKDQKLTVKTNAVNSTQTDADVVFIAAYYNGKTLVDTEAIKGKINSGTAGTASQQFTLPDMTSVTLMKVFIWNTVDKAVPYCGAAELSR